MADDIVVNIAFKGNATDFLAELSRQVGRAKTQLQEMGQSTAALSRLETQLARMSGQARNFAQNAAVASTATQGWAQKWTPFKGSFQEAEANSKNLWRSIDAGIASSEKSIGRATSALTNFDNAQRNASRATAIKSPMDDWDKQFAAATVAANANVAATKAAKAAIDAYQNSLSNARYVLYDVAGTLTILGAGLVLPLVGAAAVAANFEKEFAQVARTTGLVGSELQALKQDFDALYGSIPITYDALAKIATLAGQLGVSGDRIASFTETVAQTAAVTDLTVEQAATAFGRLDALIPNVKGQYDRLGSAIAGVGVNSVATESEIVNISTQISSMGAFAGLTAQDIIGLSGALASVGAQPELSRGTVTRVFTLMSKAVAQGGEDLERFAQLSGVSAENFAATWGTPAFGETLLGFMRGIRDEGGGAVAALNELGITSVRDVPLLLRLANAADSTGKAGALLAQTMGDGNKFWAENIELQRQFDIIAGTVAAKVQVLGNNFNLLLQAIGGPMLPAIADLVDFFTDLTRAATEFAKSDIGGAVTRTAVGLAALLGVLALAGGAMALFGASSIGVYQALQFVAVTSPRAATGLLGVAGAASLADGSLKAGAASALLFSRALAAITVVGALILLPEAIRLTGDALDEWAGNTRDAAGAAKTLGNQADLFTNSWTNMIAATGGQRNVFADFANSLTATGRAFLDLDTQMNEFLEGGDIDGLVGIMNDFREASGKSAEDVLGLFGNITGKARDAGVELEIVKGEIVATGEAGSGAAPGAADMAASLEAITQEAEYAIQSLADLKEQLDGINGTQMDAAAAADSLQSAINKTTQAIWDENGAIADHGVTLTGVNDQSIAFRDGLRQIEEGARNAGVAVLENGGTVEEAIGAWRNGRDAQIELAKRLGLSAEEAVAWADTTFGKASEVEGQFYALKTAVDAVPSNKNINVTTSGTSVAISELRRAQDAVNAIPGYKSVTIGVGGGFSDNGGNPDGKATGGRIRGPGGDTSDTAGVFRLSNDEFVVRAKAARAIGYGRLDYMNRYGNLPGFATGGRVGGTNVNVQSGPTGPVELSATDRAIMGRRGDSSTDVHLSIGELARKVNAYNAKQSKRGK